MAGAARRPARADARAVGRPAHLAGRARRPADVPAQVGKARRAAAHVAARQHQRRCAPVVVVAGAGVGVVVLAGRAVRRADCRAMAVAVRFLEARVVLARGVGAVDAGVPPTVVVVVAVVGRRAVLAVRAPWRRAIVVLAAGAGLAGPAHVVVARTAHMAVAAAVAVLAGRAPAAPVGAVALHAGRARAVAVVVGPVAGLPAVAVGLPEGAHRVAVGQDRGADAAGVGEGERRGRVARHRRALRPSRSVPRERVPGVGRVDVCGGVAVDEDLPGERRPPAGAEVGVLGDARIVHAGEDHGTLRARQEVAAAEGQVARGCVDERRQCRS